MAAAVIKRKKPREVTVEGLVVALSHIFYLEPKVFFIELLTINGRKLIFVNTQKLFKLHNKLEIQTCYWFTHLEKRIMYKGTKRAIQVLATTECSDFHENIQMELPPNIKYRENLITYEGTVTSDVNQALGHYVIDEMVDLFLTFTQCISNVPELKIGQHIIVYNAHLRKFPVTSGAKITLFTCGRSTVKIRTTDRVHGTNPFTISNKSSVVDVVLDFNCNYNDLIWIKSINEILMKKFTDDFFSKELHHSKYVPAMMEAMMYYIFTKSMEILKISLVRKPRSLAKEFILDPHDCGPNSQKESLSFRFPTLLQYAEGLTLPLDSHKTVWQHKVVDSETYSNSILLGYLTEDPSNGCLILCDNTYKFPCIVTGSLPLFRNVLNKIVLITRFSLIIEVFTTPGKLHMQERDSYTYLYFSILNAHTVYDPVGFIQKLSKDNVGEVKSALNSECNVSKQHSGGCSLCRNGECDCVIGRNSSDLAQSLFEPTVMKPEVIETSTRSRLIFEEQHSTLCSIYNNDICSCVKKAKTDSGNQCVEMNCVDLSKVTNAKDLNSNIIPGVICANSTVQCVESNGISGEHSKLCRIYRKGECNCVMSESKGNSFCTNMESAPKQITRLNHDGTDLHEVKCNGNMSDAQEVKSSFMPERIHSKMCRIYRKGSCNCVMAEETLSPVAGDSHFVISTVQNTQSEFCKPCNDSSVFGNGVQGTEESSLNIDNMQNGHVTACERESCLEEEIINSDDKTNDFCGENDSETAGHKMNGNISQNNTSDDQVAIGSDKCPNTQPMEFVLYLHHKGPVQAMLHNLKPESVFYALVTFLSGTAKNSLEAKEKVCIGGEMVDIRCGLIFKGPMVQKYYTFIANRYYKLIIPPSAGTLNFKNRGRMFFGNLSNQISIKEGFELPPEAELELLYIPRQSKVSLLVKELYSISEAKKCAINETINFEGRLISRWHNANPYGNLDGEIMRIQGFGVPGNFNIRLEIEDLRTDDRVSLYLNSRSRYIYPIGLIPGSLLSVYFVEKRSSSHKNVYFISTKLTRFEVKELVSSTVMKSSRSEGSTLCLFLSQTEQIKESNLFWGIMYPLFIIKASITAHCGKCKAPFLQGECSYVGCHAVDSCTIISKAMVSIQDGTGSAMLIAENDQVRKVLGISEGCWLTLTRHAQLHGEILHLPGKYEHINGKLSEAEETFRKYCKSKAFVRPLHILCRFLKDPKDVYGEQVQGKVYSSLRIYGIRIEELQLEKASHFYNPSFQETK